LFSPEAEKEEKIMEVSLGIYTSKEFMAAYRMMRMTGGFGVLGYSHIPVSIQTNDRFKRK
jgi:hypothetical protein